MQTTLYLARHGETLWNQLQRFQGILDSKLTEHGEHQSRQLAQQMQKKNIDAIYSSSLGRSVATASICNEMLSVTAYQNKNLTERHLGCWQGQTVTELKNEAMYDDVLHKFLDIAPSGGESAVKCGQRIHDALQDIASQSKNDNVLVIFHGEALRCFLLSLGETLKGNAYDLFKNGSVCKLVYQHEQEKFQYAFS